VWIENGCVVRNRQITSEAESIQCDKNVCLPFVFLAIVPLFFCPFCTPLEHTFSCWGIQGKFHEELSGVFISTIRFIVSIDFDCQNFFGTGLIGIFDQSDGLVSCREFAQAISPAATFEPRKSFGLL
jgi:hypothetical protein